MPTLWRDPDGQHWEETDGDEFDKEAGQWVTQLTSASQDPNTGRWSADADHGRRLGVVGPMTRAGYTEVSADPLGEPRIAHLHAIVTELLAAFEEQAGHAHPRAVELRTALEDVAALPNEFRRKRHAAAVQAARSGYQRGAGRRR